MTKCIPPDGMKHGSRVFAPFMDEHRQREAQQNQQNHDDEEEQIEIPQRRIFQSSKMRGGEKPGVGQRQ